MHDEMTERENIIARIEAIQQEIRDLHNAEVESSTELFANRDEAHRLEREWQRLDEQLAEIDQESPHADT